MSSTAGGLQSAQVPRPSGRKDPEEWVSLVKPMVGVPCAYSRYIVEDREKSN